MRPLHLVRTGYLLGIAMLLASIIYFFASNWPGMERLEKIYISGGLVVLFYGSAYVAKALHLFQGHRTFLHHLLLWAGCFSFGIALALLGQVYNSHADSYMLYGIWMIPAIAFAVITRFNSFYLLAYGLLHLTIWFYFYPVAVRLQHSDLKQAGIALLFAAINLLFLMMLQRGWLKSKLLETISYLVFHAALIWVSSSLLVNHVAYGFNALAILALVLSFWWYSKKRFNTYMLSLTALGASGYAIMKFLELAVEHASQSFFILGLIFVAILLSANVVFFRYIQRLTAYYKQPTSHSQKDKNTSHIHRETASHIVSTIVTVIGIFIGTISLIGLVVLTLESLSTSLEYENILFVLSLILIIPTLIFTNLQKTIRYTLMSIGYLTGTFAALLIGFNGQSYIPFILAVLACYGAVTMHAVAMRIFTYILFNLLLSIGLFEIIDSPVHETTVILVMTAINISIHIFLVRFFRTKKHMSLQRITLASTLMTAFLLTFMDPLFSGSYVLFNIIYAFTLIVLLVIYIHRHHVMESWITFLFGLAYLIYKYYDLLWSLLHKSITLAISGIIFLLAAYLWSTYKKPQTANTELENGPVLRNKQKLLVMLLIFVQLGYIGVQATLNEQLLSNGTSVKLSLEPLDPRSMLQGDYVRLRYEITNPDSLDERTNETYSQKKIQVVLKRGKDGLHHFARMYDGEVLQEDEVLINGITSGYGTIHYGIESYFIPEGTGQEVQNESRYAYVRISKNGNAILEDISPN